MYMYICNLVSVISRSVIVRVSISAVATVSMVTEVPVGARYSFPACSSSSGTHVFSHVIDGQLTLGISIIGSNTIRSVIRRESHLHIVTMLQITSFKIVKMSQELYVKKRKFPSRQRYSTFGLSTFSRHLD